MKNYAFPPLGEFEFIDSVLKNSIHPEPSFPKKREWLSAGDDAALFDGWLITKDMSAEGTHFRLDFSTPEEAVEKNIVSNISDISAMGGTPKLALLGICNARHWSAQTRTRIANAFGKGLSKRNIALIGGDTITAETGLFSLTLLGLPGSTVLKRNAAKPGDKIYVVGSLGKSAAGLWILFHQKEASKKYERLVKYHLCPAITENMGALLAESGISGACMDISDGLSSELNHLALSSAVSFKIDKNKLPVDEDVLKMSLEFSLEPFDFALNGGEEYQLLFTTSDKNSIFKLQEFYSITEIGEVVEGSQVYLLDNGTESILPAKAWTHL